MFQMKLCRVISKDLPATTAEQLALLGWLEHTVSGNIALIGRLTDCQVVFQREDPHSERASRKHARIQFDANTGKAKIDDLGSTNGTFLNGQRITTTRDLKDGDIIAPGQAQLRVEISDLDSTGDDASMTMAGGTAQMASMCGLPPISDDGGKSMIG